MPWWAWVVVGALVGVTLLFNTMIRRKNAVAFAFAAIDVMLKKRYDLIPNLVTICKTHMDYERSVLAEITALRAKALDSKGDETIEVNGKLSGRLGRLMALAESYPQLKASESFDALRRSLNEVEDQIAAARRAYNAAVLAYNNGCEMFPTSLLALAMHYSTRKTFEIEDAERAPVKVFGS